MGFRNVILLSICGALSVARALALMAGAIVGQDLAPSPGWATLPITIMVVGTAAFTVPAAMAMKRIGRRLGFTLAALMALIGALGAAGAIVWASFPLFCLSMFLMGGNTAFVQQYRFAAAESVEKPMVGRAVSFVLLGGLLAGFLGPEVARRGRDWLSLGAYSGSFVALAGLYGVAVLLLLFLRDVTPPQEEAVGGAERPLRTIVAQPVYLVAVWCGVIAYGIMGFIMTATPISMHLLDGFSLDQLTLVIQAHGLAMYLPSLFAGFLVDRLGSGRLKPLGVVSMAAGIAVALPGHGFLNYLIGLALVGVGWNFLFVGGTVLLTRSYLPSERFKAQAVNDFAIFGVQAAVTLLAGWAMFHVSWQWLNLMSLPFLMLTLVLLFWMRRVDTAPAAAEP